jgi:hypothetical protein
VSAPAAQRDTALLAPYLRLREVLRRAEAVVQPGPDAAPLVGVLLAAAAAHPLPDATESEQARWRALLATAPAVEQYDVSLEEEAAERDAERDAERSNALAGSWQGEEASAVLDVAACEVSAEVRPEPSDE